MALRFDFDFDSGGWLDGWIAVLWIAMLCHAMLCLERTSYSKYRIFDAMNVSLGRIKSLELRLLCDFAIFLFFPDSVAG